jgi:predicted metalloprotease with PDZ domain
MLRPTIRSAGFFAISALFAAPFVSHATSPAAPSNAPLKYELAFERPNTHLLDVTIHASDLKGSTTQFAMPDWAPGSYNIENYAANIQRFRATSAEGKELAWHKTDSQTWQIDLASATAVTVSYQVFANTLQNNVAQYNDRHAFIGGPSVWMYLIDGKERPIELTVATPSGWKIATGMEHTSDHTFQL